MGTTQKPNRICRICLSDCAGIPRIKDKRGRYYCLSCYEEVKAKQRDNEAPANAAGSSMNDSTLAETCADIPALDESSSGSSVMSQIFEDTDKPCPGCGVLSPVGTVTCIECGYNWQTGVKIEYELLTKSTSYEFEDVEVSIESQQKDLAVRRIINRMEYAVPTMIILVSAGLTCLIKIPQSGLAAGVAYLISLLAMVIIGGLIFSLFVILWIGRDEPYSLIFLKLAGIYALVDVSGYFLLMIPIQGAGWAMIVHLVSLGLYIELFRRYLRLILLDAVIMSVLSMIFKLVLSISVVEWSVSWLSNYLTT